jgi:CubicO group peptidase (beta-lactamase class C family)
MATIAQPRRHLPRGEDFLLLSPSEQAHAYANVDRMFATRRVPRGPTVTPLPYGPEVAPLGADGSPIDIAAAMARLRIAGLLLICDGAVVLERYALGLDEMTRWSTMSMVKSLTSTLVGAALHDGAIVSVDEPVSRYVAALRGSAYDAVRIRDLLTMSSGVGWSEDYTDRASDVNRYSKSLGDKVPGGVLAQMRALRAEAEPGTRFQYNTGDTYVLGCVVATATGGTLAEYMSRSFWAPLGMEQDAFYTLESEGGQEIGGSRAGMALRDLGRFGVFLLGDGTIAGQRVLPEYWLEEAGRSYFALDPATNSYGAIGYGFSWWLPPEGGMAAVGFAGQSLHVDRARGTVLVMLAARPQPPFDAAYGIDFKAETAALRRALLQNPSS